MTAELFPEFVRTRVTPKRQNEGGYSFLNEAESLFWDRQRKLLDEWYSRFPVDAKDDLRARFVSDDRAQSEGAFWELYLHETLRRAGYELTPHPEVSGTTRRPDFLARRREESFYIEGVVALPGNERERAAERVVDQIYDELNKVHSPNFFLDVHVEVEGTQAPPVRKVREALEPWLVKLDPDVVMQRLTGGNIFMSGEQYTWSDAAWQITFTAIPKSPASRGKPGLRPVGITGSVGSRSMIVDDRKPIRQVLDKKVARYGSLDAPYIIAVLAREEFPGPRTIELVLFGDPGSQLDREARAAAGLDGLFFSEDAKRVAAVVAATELASWTIARHMPVLWHNPLARQPLASTALPWDVMAWDSSQKRAIRSALGVEPDKFFELPPDWPGPEEPFPRD